MDTAAASLFAPAAAKPRCVFTPLHVARGSLPPCPHTRAARALLAVRCAHSRAPPPPPPPPLPRADGSEGAAAAAHPRLRLRRLAEEFRALPSDADRARRLLSLASALPRLPEPDRAPGNRVMGCIARVWLAARCDDAAGRMRFAADSDSELSRGYCACLVAALDGAAPEEVLAVDPADPDLAPLGAGMAAARSRASTWHNLLVAMQKRARAAIAAREGRHPGEPFPSLVIARDGAVRAQGSYAEAQNFKEAFVVSQ